MALSEENKEMIRRDYLSWSGGAFPHENVDENGTHETYALHACGVRLDVFEVWDFIDEWAAELEAGEYANEVW